LYNLLDVPIGMLLPHVPDESKEKTRMASYRQAATVKNAGKPQMRKAKP
jgi:Na+/melibiose symporter-like transporter